jgi:hypothetical protein
MTLLWACACGERVWLHIRHCPACGRDRPAPPPEPVPDDKVRPEPSVALADDLVQLLTAAGYRDGTP